MRSRWTVLSALLLGLGGGYLLGLRHGAAPGVSPTLPAAVTLPVRYGDLGPGLLQVGAIDPERLADELAGRGRPLSEAQRRLLKEGGDDAIQVDRDNGLFLLDLFWALGLTNRNPILTRGPMARSGGLEIGRFASTGGWKLGAKPSTELYASEPLVELTAAEQARLARVAHRVYRPCCDNPADFPDCNHGMAMLGMLTLLASGGSTEAQMFGAAAAANAVWYPQQYGELAVHFEAMKGTAIRDIDPRRLVSREVASGSGFRAVHESLAAAGLLAPAPSAGGSAC